MCKCLYDTILRYTIWRYATFFDALLKCFSPRYVFVLLFFFVLAYLYIERGVCGLGVVYVIACVNGRGVDEKEHR